MKAYAITRAGRQPYRAWQGASMLALLTALALWLALGAATEARAQAAPAAAEASGVTAGPPAGFVAPDEPKPDETNAQRSKSQPGNNAPFWRAVRNSGEQAGTIALPGLEKGVLVQRFVDYPGSRLTTAGEGWREVRNRILLPYGGSLLLIIVVAMALFYWRKGPMGHAHGDGGMRIERFTPLERAAHWTNAIAFVCLAISGITMAWGKFFLLPVLGHDLFGGLTYALKTLHNFVGPLFAVSLLIVILTFVKDNIATLADFRWLKTFGGMFSGKHVPSHRFNAGEKGMFWWGITVPGVVIVASGLVLDMLFPVVEYTRGNMQIAHMIHAVAATLMMAALLGHIYMGTIGMRGAYKAMRTGYTNEGWAKEHHELWYDDIKAGKIPAQRSGHKAPAPLTPRGRTA